MSCCGRGAKVTDPVFERSCIGMMTSTAIARLHLPNGCHPAAQRRDLHVCRPTGDIPECNDAKVFALKRERAYPCDPSEMASAREYTCRSLRCAAG